MVDVKEGFLCPICLTDLGDFNQLHLHFAEKHSKDTDPVFVQSLKDLFGKAKKKILVNNEEDTFQTLVGELSSDLLYGPVFSEYNPISGIHHSVAETETTYNIIPAVSHNDFFRNERSKRADMKAMDTNKLILRLERLMTSLPVDPVKRRTHEQSIVSWLPEEDVKLCPNCAKSFNLTRRKHHCRLCGAIMCNDCSTTVSFELANRVIHPATIAKYSPVKDDTLTNQSKIKSKFSTPKKSYDALVSNIADLTGFSEAQSHFRSCCFCREVLERRDASVRVATQPPSNLVVFYNQLQKFMAEGMLMNQKYCEMAAGLNSGESTHEQLSEAKILRLKILKMAEIVDAASKKIATLELEDEDLKSSGTHETLIKRIRQSAVNFIKETLVGLPSVPTEEQLKKLQEKRKKDAENKIVEEKIKAKEAKERFEQQQLLQNQPSLQSGSGIISGDHPVKKFLSPSTSSNNLESVKYQLSNAYDGLLQKAALVPKKSLFGAQPSAQRVRPVTFGSGFVTKASEAGGADLDPLVQQMHNLRQYISQARSAGVIEDAKILEQNLRDLQEEYQKMQERRELEDNYKNFKSVLGSKSPLKNSVDDDDNFDESNPFGEEEIEEFLNDPTNPFATGDYNDNSSKDHSN